MTRINTECKQTYGWIPVDVLSSSSEVKLSESIIVIFRTFQIEKSKQETELSPLIGFKESGVQISFDCSIELGLSWPCLWSTVPLLKLW